MGEEVKNKDLVLEAIDSRDLKSLKVSDCIDIIKQSIFKYYKEHTIGLRATKPLVDHIIDYFGEDDVDFNIDSIESLDTFWGDVQKGVLVVDLFNLNQGDIIRISETTNIDPSSFKFYTLANLMFPSGSLLNTEGVESMYRTLIEIIVKKDISNFHLYTITSSLCYVLIRFKKLRVTNEKNNYIDIYDTFVKIPININLLDFSFLINRSTYTYPQLLSGYKHSHVSTINPFNYNEFHGGCLGGSNAPIISSLSALKDVILKIRIEETDDLGKHEEALEIASKVFCTEVVRYLETESVAGGPYIHLSTVTSRDSVTYTNFAYEYKQYYITDEAYRKFFKYYIKRCNLRFAYKNGHYTVGTTFIEYMRDINNAFIDFYNELMAAFFPGTIFDTYRKAFKNGAIVGDKVIYYNSPIRESKAWDDLEGEHLFMFKGEAVKLSIIRDSEEVDTAPLINYTLAMCILSEILIIINTNYGKENASKEEESNGSGVFKWSSETGEGTIKVISEEDTASNQKHFYIL